MNKYLVIFGIFVTSVFSQTNDIPFDWSGQYGVVTNNGRLMWNQDWILGVLLIDGTFTNYPTRIGSSYINNFELLNTGDFYDEIHSFPDSSQIKSKIDYFRGDFSYDQLEIDAQFLEISRVISFNGFKRTYNGPYGQYNDPRGGNNPLQQSYRLDYSSKDKDENLDISIGHFITDSRLRLDDPADFMHKEKIVSAGIGYSKKFINWQYKVHGALFQQYYKMNFDSTEAYINRAHLNQFLGKKLNNLSTLKFGIEIDIQGYSIVDKTKKDRFWSTLYGGWGKQYIGINFGTTIAQDEMFPFFNILAHSNINKFIKWESYLKYEAIPKHIFLLDKTDGNDFEQWFSVHADAKINWKYFPINLSVDFFNNQKTFFVQKYYINDKLIDISNNLFSASISTQIPIFRDWKIDAYFHHTFKHNYYSDGIGDRARIGLTISENIFKNNLFAKMRLWGDAYLNHHKSLGYEGFHFGPYLTDDTNLALPDYWVFNLELSAKISSMTILWRINNILQTSKSLTDQLFPNLDENYLLITNSNNFPPMNRFVIFNIIWNFKD